MDYDLLLVLGIVIGVLTLPSLASAISDGRAPRTGTIMAMVAGILIVTAVSQRPSGYAFSDVPDAFYRTFARYAP